MPYLLRFKGHHEHCVMDNNNNIPIFFSFSCLSEAQEQKGSFLCNLIGDQG